MQKKLKEKISEALSSVLPITVIVLLLSFTLAPMPIGTLVLFLLGATLLIVGMGFFSLGADIAMMPMGDQMGRRLSSSQNLVFIALVCFLIGVTVTIAEPDLQVLARQVPAVPDFVIIITVAVGVGVFLLDSMLRTRFGIPLQHTLLVLYAAVFLLSIFVPNEFLAVAFDSGGVSSGPMTATFLLPFAMGACQALGGDVLMDAFGVVAMVAMTPLITIQILGLFYQCKLRRTKDVTEEEERMLVDDIIDYAEKESNA